MELSSRQQGLELLTFPPRLELGCLEYTDMDGITKLNRKNMAEHKTFVSLPLVSGAMVVAFVRLPGLSV